LAKKKLETLGQMLGASLKDIMQRKAVELKYLRDQFRHKFQVLENKKQCMTLGQYDTALEKL